MVIIMNKFFIYVFFDIYNKNLRNKISEKCKDYGLSKVQYYLFSGYLTKNRIEKMKSDITNILNNKKIMLLILPICNNCFKNIFVINNKRIVRRNLQKQDNTKIKFGMDLNKFFLNYED